MSLLDLAQNPPSGGAGGVWSVGDVKDWPHARLPADGKWMYRAGQALGRVTYGDLFELICPAFTGDTTAGSDVIENIIDLEGIAAGALVEGPGVPVGATVVSVDALNNALTLSDAASATAVSADMRFTFTGFGDGVSTFNLDDMRGRVSVGRDDMGGVDAGAIAGDERLGQSLGSDSVRITLDPRYDIGASGGVPAVQAITGITQLDNDLSLLQPSRITNKIIKVLS